METSVGPSGQDYGDNQNSNREQYHHLVASADDALNHLYSAQKELDKAYGWGVYDMLGGGMFGSLIKHGKLQNANREIEEAKKAVTRFAEDLRVSNIDANAGLHIDTGDFLSFTDIFLDNVFADMMMQQRIMEAQQQVDQAIRQITYIRDQLV